MDEYGQNQNSGIIEIPDPTPEFAPAPGYAPAPAPAKNRKPLFIIAGVVLAAVILLIILLAGKGGKTEIEGSWKCLAIRNDGVDTYMTTDEYGSDFVVKGNKWELTIRGNTTSTFKGTLELEAKEKLDDGEYGYVYTLTSDTGGQIKAFYSSSTDMLTIFTSNGLDMDNSSTYIRNQ